VECKPKGLEFFQETPVQGPLEAPDDLLEVDAEALGVHDVGKVREPCGPLGPVRPRPRAASDRFRRTWYAPSSMTLHRSRRWPVSDENKPGRLAYLHVRRAGRRGWCWPVRPDLSPPTARSA